MAFQPLFIRGWKQLSAYVQTPLRITGIKRLSVVFARWFLVHRLVTTP